ncbi:MAG: sigma-70 family RNA polymerase sigma factor [Patescibacteria group bacterium]
MENQLTAKQEQSLVNAARQDIGEFAKIYEYYKNRIFRYIRFRVSTLEEAEDLTSQTFLQAIEYLHKYQDQGSRFGAWLYKIAGNLVCDWYRRKKPILLEVEELDKQSNNIAYDNLNKIDAEIQQKQLIFCINQLKIKEQQVIILKIFEELTFQQIAKFLSQKESKTKMIYYRSLDKIKKIYEKR